MSFKLHYRFKFYGSSSVYSIYGQSIQEILDTIKKRYICHYADLHPKHIKLIKYKKPGFNVPNISVTYRIRISKKARKVSKFGYHNHKIELLMF